MMSLIRLKLCVIPLIGNKIADSHPNIQDQVRRAYILKGPTRPTVKFDRKKIGSKNRAFSKNWYKNYEWLEYIVT